jgi:hypothetical protein
MQREILDGIPFWTDKDGNFYYYDASAGAIPKALKLGTKAADGSIKFVDNYRELLDPSLAAYRASLSTRSRKPAATASASK